MATYDIDEARLVVPDGWQDRSVNSLEYLGKQGQLKVIVSRHDHRNRKLTEMVDEIVVDMRRRLAGFEQLAKDEVLLDGQPAIELRVRFKDGPESYDQRSLWLLAGSKCVTVGVLATPKTQEDGEALWAEVRGSLRRRPRDEGEEEPLHAAPPLGPPPTET
jgi:hypothetical protein